MLWICCTTSCTTNPQQIRVVEFGFKPLLRPKSAKSRKILRKFELIAVQGHPRSSIWCQAKAHMQLFIINNNFGRISYRFRDSDEFSSKIARFPTPPLYDAQVKLKVPCHFRSRERKFLGAKLQDTKVPKNESFGERKFHQWYFRSWERKYVETKVP